MTLDKFEDTFKGLVDKWKEDYKNNHAKDPENWPIDTDFAAYYEDFSIWMQLTGENL